MGIIQYTGDADGDTTLPIWVSRPDGEGTIYKVTIGIPMLIFTLLVGQLAVALWLLIALVAGVLVAGGAVVDLIGGIL